MRQRPPNKWGILFSVIFGIFMVILDATVVNVAFPTLRREFGVGVTESQWVISVYTMALGIVALPPSVASSIRTLTRSVSGVNPRTARSSFVLGGAM
jgi:MFS family permease